MAMIGNSPPRPTGDSQFENFLKRIWDKCFGPEGRILNSDTVTADYTTKGIKLNAAPPGGGGTSLIQCVVTQLYGTPGNPVDYIGVTKFDLSTMSLIGSQFFCAKCITGRQPSSELIDGETITYSNYNAALLPANNPDNVRLATFSPTTNEYQVVSPRYLALANDTVPAGGDISQYIILVSPLQNSIGVTDSSGNQVKFIEVSPVRAWCWSPYLNGGND